ncbi:hypothetical protein AMJ49_03260 [Parcubacteria bacterium DG_74_2]|nr:MAG: hypothetical protein AMJ49_03260 [Parcubacteria bacterium DG_74_2]
MEENYYIHYNGFQYNIIDFGDVLKLTSEIVVSLCTSWANAETNENFDKMYQKNGTNMVIANSCWGEEMNNPNSKGYMCGSSNKYELVKNIRKIDVDAIELPFIGKRFDMEAVLAAEPEGIVLCADLHTAANALSRGRSYIYKIHKDQLKKANGLKNYRLRHIEEINRFSKEIKTRNKKL